MSRNKHAAMWIGLLPALMVLTACASWPALGAATASQLKQNIIAQPAASPQVSDSTAIAHAQRPAETGEEDAVSVQQVALFAIEPLSAPCCPAPTPDQALAAALSVPGVMTAELVDDATITVQFDPAQTDTLAIASTINQASFLVTVQEPAAMAQGAIAQD
jgi:hypothetical protein